MKFESRKGLPRFTFALALLTMTESTHSGNRVFAYVLAGLLAATGLILAAEKASSRLTWKTIVSDAKALDLGYVALGFGIVNYSAKLMANSSFLAAGLFLVPGLLVSGLAIGELLAKSQNRILQENLDAGAVVGCIWFVVCLTWLYASWSTASGTGILPRLNASMVPILMTSAGLITFCVGLMRLAHRSKLEQARSGDM